MLFFRELQPDTNTIYSYMGYGATPPDIATVEAAGISAARIVAATRAKWCAASFGLRFGEEGVALADTGITLPGSNIAAHLDGCQSCVLFAVTLGVGADAALRAAGAGDMRDAVLMDTAASVLVEQYADEAQVLALERYNPGNLYTTGRFSPGYGDLPLSVQNGVVALLDATRAIGLSVSESGILVPRKSVTAIMGLSAEPVTGALAGCDTCALAATCKKDKPCATARRE